MAVTSRGPSRQRHRTLAFVPVNALAGLHAALLAALGVAVVAFVGRQYRGEPLRPALVGLLVVAACAAVAAGLGQARGCFLLPATIPFVMIAARTIPSCSVRCTPRPGGCSR